MNVYCVWRCVEYEGESLVDVYESEMMAHGRAIAEKEKLEDYMTDCHFYVSTETVIRRVNEDVTEEIEQIKKESQNG